MKTVSDLMDFRINSRNILVEINIGEYIDLIRGVLHKNEFQRRQVKSSKTVYALLKNDLERGCIIPPVVLAISSDHDSQNLKTEDFNTFIETNKSHLVILDGLQRTHTMMRLLDDLRSSGDDETYRKVSSHPIRAEVYIGLNRLGILYRMLTLNTGQTPMSLRQQIEILYLDYANCDLNGVELVRESDGKGASKINQYNFKDIIEGFNSYLNRDELPIDRSDLLENIESLEKLSIENQSTDLFAGFVQAWYNLVKQIFKLCENHELGDEFTDNYGTPFGKNAVQLIKKSQAIAGFGAAIGRLRDFKLIKNFDEIANNMSKLQINDPMEFLEQMNRSLLWIKGNTTKIGNAQRSFFQYFFRSLLNPEDDSFLDLDSAAEVALRKFQSQML